MLKLFDNCKELITNKSGKMVTGMESDEGEKYDLKETKKAEGAVEIWMSTVDAEMQSTLHRLTKEAVYNYHNQERIPWALREIGMVTIVST
jgi:dynein heavy chain